MLEIRFCPHRLLECQVHLSIGKEGCWNPLDRGTPISEKLVWKHGHRAQLVHVPCVPLLTCSQALGTAWQHQHPGQSSSTPPCSHSGCLLGGGGGGGGDIHLTCIQGFNLDYRIYLLLVNATQAGRLGTCLTIDKTDTSSATDQGHWAYTPSQPRERAGYSTLDPLNSETL